MDKKTAFNLWLGATIIITLIYGILHFFIFGEIATIDSIRYSSFIPEMLPVSINLWTDILIYPILFILSGWFIKHISKEKYSVIISIVIFSFVPAAAFVIKAITNYVTYGLWVVYIFGTLFSIYSLIRSLFINDWDQLEKTLFRLLFYCGITIFLLSGWVISIRYGSLVSSIIGLQTAAGFIFYSIPGYILIIILFLVRRAFSVQKTNNSDIEIPT